MKKRLVISAVFAVILSGLITAAILSTSRKTISSGVFLSDIEALASSESPYSCTVRVNCWEGGGYVECTGTVCSRTGWSVTCDGHTTEC